MKPCLRDERISRDVSRRHLPPHPVVNTDFGGDNHICLVYPCAAQETRPEFLGMMLSMSFSPQSGDANYAEFERAAREISDRGAVGWCAGRRICNRVANEAGRGAGHVDRGLERAGVLTVAGARETAVPAVDALLSILARRGGSALSPETLSSFLPDKQQANKQDKHRRRRNSPCR